VTVAGLVNVNVHGVNAPYTRRREARAQPPVHDHSLSQPGQRLTRADARVSLFSRLYERRLAGIACCGNNEHSSAGLDVCEHFREPEFAGQENHGWLS